MRTLVTPERTHIVYLRSILTNPTKDLRVSYHAYLTLLPITRKEMPITSYQHLQEYFTIERCVHARPRDAKTVVFSSIYDRLLIFLAKSYSPPSITLDFMQRDMAVVSSSISIPPFPLFSNYDQDSPTYSIAKQCPLLSFRFTSGN